MDPSSVISTAQMKRVLDVTRLLTVTADLDLLLLRMAESACEIMACERASIFLHDAKTDELWTKVALHSKEIRVPSGAGIVGAAFKANSLLHVPDPYNDPRFNRGPDERSGFRTRNLLTCPMVDLAGKPVGVVQAVNKRTGAFVSSDEALIQLLSDQAGVAFQRYNLQQEAIQEAKRATALQREMELALEVQQAMLPEHAPKIAGIEVAGYTKPASITGGDCYDLWKTADGRLGIFVGDATGHGIGPALVVSQTRTLIRAMCDLHPSPRELLDRANARLHEDLDAGKFVTAFVGFLAPDGKLDWCSAGHGPILIRRGGGQPIQALDANAPPLGVIPDFFTEDVTVAQLAPGGMICVTSDGIAEAFDPGGDQFGVERLTSILESSPQSPGEHIIGLVQQAVRQWQQNDEPKDDQTMVIASWTAS